ncbi:MAG TPA: hypothetical protein VIU62_19430 [Chloroflexota bacterium]
MNREVCQGALAVLCNAAGSRTPPATWVSWFGRHTMLRALVDGGMIGVVTFAWEAVTTPVAAPPPSFPVGAVTLVGHATYN